MKFCAAVALLLIAGIVASGDALPARKSEFAAQRITHSASTITI